jgi:hypothetical protein
VVALRTPVARPPRQRFSDEALDLFAQMLRPRRCTCPPHPPDLPHYEEVARCKNCQRYDELHSKLFHCWPSRKPWFWPVVERPGTECPHPHVQGAARIFAEAQHRWTEIAEALAERERLARSRQP